MTSRNSIRINALLTLAAIVLVLGACGYAVVREVRNPDPHEGDICASPGEIVVAKDGTQLICR